MAFPHQKNWNHPFGTCWWALHSKMWWTNRSAQSHWRRGSSAWGCFLLAHLNKAFEEGAYIWYRIQYHHPHSAWNINALLANVASEATEEIDRLPYSPQKGVASHCEFEFKIADWKKTVMGIQQVQQNKLKADSNSQIRSHHGCNELCCCISSNLCILLWPMSRRHFLWCHTIRQNCLPNGLNGDHVAAMHLFGFTQSPPELD